jgi:Tol biopolymer transport system component
VKAGVVAIAMVAQARAQAQSFVPVSVATDGTFGNSTSSGGVFSANGRFVAFASGATNLVAGDTNLAWDVFVRDLVAHTTERVSVTQTGAERPDGTFVAFSSRAPLVDADTNSCTLPRGPLFFDVVNCSDIYVRNRTTGAVERVSVASDGTQANGESGEPSISADGRYVVFMSSATNLVAGDTNGLADLFLHDRVTHVTTRLSMSSAGTELTPSGINSVISPGVISGDGQTVLFRTSIPGVVSDPDTLPCPPPRAL